MKNEKIKSYPVLFVNKSKLFHNIKTVKETCESQGIKIAGIIKGFNGIPGAVEQFQLAGCAQIGTSRLEQIIDARVAGIDAKYMLIRIPMLSEVSNVVRWADMSLNSESRVISEIQAECVKQGKRHGVILMADLGDLREGYWDKDALIKEAVRIENELNMVDLLGVGTNLGCYGSINPTRENMEELCDIAQRIEGKIGRKLEIVSGGASTSYPLVLSHQMPKGINHLRIGEAITVAYDLKEIYHLDDGGLNTDCFVLQSEIIEIKDKPTHPVGEIFVDCYGSKPTYVDRGIRRRALVAMGRLDYALLEKILPMNQGVTLVGSSSDHTIVDIEDCEREWCVGDVLTFALTYPSLMYLSGNRYVDIVYCDDEKE